jgi:hypothetical protein
MADTASIGKIREILGDTATLLDHECKTIAKDRLHLPNPRYVDDVFTHTDRSPRVLGALQRMYDTGRLGGTGYLSILPVDQGIEHSAGASFAPNPAMFDPEAIVELAVEGGCNAVASTFGVLGAVARKWAHRIPFIVKINHNELMSYPNTYDQTLFGSVRQASTWAPRASARRSTGARPSRAASSSRSPRPSPRPTGSGCSPSCGATSATTPSRPPMGTTTWRPTSRARPTTSA